MKSGGRATGNQYDGFEPYAAKLIAHRARKLVGRAGFVAADQPDLEQELVLDLVRRLPHFDPQLAKRETFITRLVDHRVATLVESQQAAIRHYQRLERLDDLDLEIEDGAASRRTTEEDLKMDVRRAIAALPDDLRALCRELEISTVSEIARQTGLARRALYARIAKLQRHFEGLGLSSFH